jgi:hypothetical protein
VFAGDDISISLHKHIPVSKVQIARGASAASFASIKPYILGLVLLVQMSVIYRRSMETSAENLPRNFEITCSSPLTCY